MSWLMVRSWFLVFVVMLRCGLGLGGGLLGFFVLRLLVLRLFVLRLLVLWGLVLGCLVLGCLVFWLLVGGGIIRSSSVLLSGVA